MADEELASVPQDVIVCVLQDFYESGEKECDQYNEKDLQRIADQYLSNAHDIMLEEIAESPPSLYRDSNLDIGDSITVHFAEEGDCDTSGWGLWVGDADYDVGSEIGECYVATGIVGGALAWARTGHTFEFSGSGSGYYRIDMDCEWICTTVMWGTCTLSLLFEEWEDNKWVPTPFQIDQYSAGIGSEHNDSFEHSTPSYVRLEAGGVYRISLLVETEAGTIGSAAGADCLSSYYDSCWDYLHLQYIP